MKFSVEFADLVVYGFLGAVPATPRLRPLVFSASLLDRHSGTVFVPPFGIEEDALASAQWVLRREEFDELVEEGEATLASGALARPDGCFFVPEGYGEPEFTSLATAALRLSKFAELRVAEGDRKFHMGDSQGAVAAYADAAAVSQTPEHYALLARTLPAGARKQRVMRLLSQVSRDRDVMETQSKIEIQVWQTPEEKDCWEASARQDGKEGWGCETTPEEAAKSAVVMLRTSPSHLPRKKPNDG